VPVKSTVEFIQDWNNISIN